MKYLFKNRLAFIGVVASCFLLSSCFEEKYEVHEDGYFKYIYVNDSNQKENSKRIAITGFTQSGLDQEAIDIPFEINGCSVYKIGFYNNKVLSGYNEYGVICGDKLKKIFIHSNVEMIEHFTGENVNIMVCSSVSRYHRGNFVKCGKTYFCKQLYTELGYDDPNNQSAGNLADVAFLYNYSSDTNETICRIDNLNSENKIDFPPEPTREGYSFTGWYTEPECAYIWDFNNAPLISQGDEFNLYAGWDAK